MILHTKFPALSLPCRVYFLHVILILARIYFTFLSLSLHCPYSNACACLCCVVQNELGVPSLLINDSLARIGSEQKEEKSSSSILHTQNSYFHFARTSTDTHTHTNTVAERMRQPLGGRHCVRGPEHKIRKPVVCLVYQLRCLAKDTHNHLLRLIFKTIASSIASNFFFPRTLRTHDSDVQSA